MTGSAAVFVAGVAVVSPVAVVSGGCPVGVSPVLVVVRAFGRCDGEFLLVFCLLVSDLVCALSVSWAWSCCASSSAVGVGEWDVGRSSCKDERMTCIFWRRSSVALEFLGVSSFKVRPWSMCGGTGWLVRTKLVTCTVLLLMTWISTGMASSLILAAPL